MKLFYIWTIIREYGKYGRRRVMEVSVFMLWTKEKKRKTIYEVFCIYKIGIYVKYRKYILYIKYIGLLFVIKIINSNFAKNSMN